jgi:cytoskeletal protein CcmA (bactofilin family)
MDKLQDLKISGMSKMNGGKFDYVDISGVGKIYGDVEANILNISGVGNVEGNIKAVRMDIEGTSNVKGNIECAEVNNSGSVKVGGRLKTDILKSNGMCRVGGSVKAKQIFSYGVLNSGADVEAEEFDSEGVFNINGLLNANRIDIKVGYRSSVKEIGGEEITVKKAKTMGLGFAMRFIGKSKCLRTELIEGTNISIEYTEADVIRGENIKIGAKCIVDLVEYSGTLEVDPSSVVKSQKKVE